MKQFVFCIVFWVFISGCMTTGKVAAPEKLVSNYFELMVLDDMQSLSEYMHPDELIKFKNMMQPVFLSLMKNSETPVPVSFSKGQSLERIKLDTSAEFFSRFMGFVTSNQSGIKDALKNTTIEPIGHVKDGERVHVVVKMTSKVKELEMSKLTVMSLKKDKDQWKLMLTGEIKGIAQMMKSKMM